MAEIMTGANRGFLTNPAANGDGMHAECAWAPAWPFMLHAHTCFELIFVQANGDHHEPAPFRWRIADAEGVAETPAAIIVAPGLPHSFWTDGRLQYQQRLGGPIRWWDSALSDFSTASAWKPMTHLLLQASRGVMITGPSVSTASTWARDEGGGPAQRAARLLLVLAVLSEGERRECAPTAGTQVDFRRDRERLAEVDALLLRSFREPLSLAQAARRCGMSATTLNGLLKRQRRTTFLAELNRIRIERAKEALRFSTEEIIAIALSCGFGSISTFNRRFAQQEGVNPQQWRRLHAGRGRTVDV